MCGVGWRAARNVPGAEIVAVAARDEARAIRYAKKYAIPRVHARYEACLHIYVYTAKVYTDVDVMNRKMDGWMGG